jgi:hypothetical protein
VSEHDVSNLHGRAEDLLLRAAPLVAGAAPTLRPVGQSARTPPGQQTELDLMIDDLTAAEAELSTLIAGRDNVLGRVRVMLGALFATRYLSGSASEDRLRGLHLLREAHSDGYLTADSDATAMLLLAVLLLPLEATGPESPEVIGYALAIGRQLAADGPMVEDLHEVRRLLDEVSIARPDDPRVWRLAEFSNSLNLILKVSQDLASGTSASSSLLMEMASFMPSHISSQMEPLFQMERLLSATLDAAEIESARGGWAHELSELAWSIPEVADIDHLIWLAEQYEARSDDEPEVLGVAPLLRLIHAIHRHDFDALSRAEQQLRAIETHLASPPTSQSIHALIAKALAAAEALRAQGEQVTDVPVSIYISDAEQAGAVERAVEEWLATAQLAIADRDDPVLGSWWRRMRARVQLAMDTETARELAMTAVVAAETRLVTAETAKVSGLLLESVSKVVPALDGLDAAVIQAGSVLIVKNGKSLAVFTLSPAQQFHLAHNPDLLNAPSLILGALGLDKGQDSVPREEASAARQDDAVPGEIGVK